MPETYQIIFNSQGKNVLNNTNLNSVVYSVNWAAFLPQKYKKFKGQFIFKSEDYDGGLTANCFVGLNMGRMEIYDGQQMTTNIGVISHSYYFDLNVSYFTATVNDNMDFYCDYPNNSTVTVSLKSLAGVALDQMCHYVLTLSLTGIE